MSYCTTTQSRYGCRLEKKLSRKCTMQTEHCTLLTRSQGGGLPNCPGYRLKVIYVHGSYNWLDFCHIWHHVTSILQQAYHHRLKTFNPISQLYFAKHAWYTFFIPLFNWVFQFQKSVQFLNFQKTWISVKTRNRSSLLAARLPQKHWLTLSYKVVIT